MSWKGALAELPIALSGRLVNTLPTPPSKPESIFILRNNDIGDLLVTTPLFEALHNLFPNAKLVVAVGDWNKETLLNNPYVDEVVLLDAPWCNRTVHGKSMAQVTKNSLKYIFTSQQVANLARRKFDIGIDVYGSLFGSALLLKLGVPYRMGVKGYFAGGGHSACSATVAYDSAEHVSRQNLRFAEPLGLIALPESRPQIFLSEQERSFGAAEWPVRGKVDSKDSLRVVVAPGAGIANKSWGDQNFIELTRRLAAIENSLIKVLGSRADQPLGDLMAANNHQAVNTCGAYSLRQSFAVIAETDLVFCNSSMIMHVAAAFRKPEVVLLSNVFGTSEQHQAQWGYPDTCCILRADQDTGASVSVDEALRSGLALVHAGASKNSKIQERAT